MPTAWFTDALEALDNQQMGLYAAKAEASHDRAYQQELKVVLRGFAHAKDLVLASPPQDDEARHAYLARIVPSLSTVPPMVDRVDRSAWLNGVRTVVRELRRSTEYVYPPLDDVQQPSRLWVPVQFVVILAGLVAATVSIAAWWVRDHLPRRRGGSEADWDEYDDRYADAYDDDND